MLDNPLELLRQKFTGKKVLVVGLGIQGGGVGIVKFFHQLGARVKVTDLKDEKKLEKSLQELKGTNVELALGRHEMSDFFAADYIFKGPSVPWTMSEIVEAQKRGIPVDMEVSLFMEYCPAKVIGITGTRGKSTTTMMVGEMLKKNGYPAHLAGNIPQTSTITLLNILRPTDWVVLELSSWQLSGFHRKKISPHISILTNIFPDHLNYYKNIDEYFYDKKAIYLYQQKGDCLIVNSALRKDIEKDQVKSRVEYFDASGFPEKLANIKGQHNLENASAAYTLASVLGLDLEKTVRVLSNFKGLPYRQEPIGQKHGVIFINDTTSTTPTATSKAIEAWSSKDIVLVLGGNSKGLPYEKLLTDLHKVKKIVLLKGSFTDEIMSALMKDCHEKIIGTYDNLAQAVARAYHEAKHIYSISNSQVCLLFSPAATSFAMFNNEFHRGDEFNRVTREIIDNE